ncbi:hypothetical protein Btru_055677 [Bulinus truncatus]|nr:hypothetical protein Btru_055677 [Bulinus truncatus]
MTSTLTSRNEIQSQSSSPYVIQTSPTQDDRSSTALFLSLTPETMNSVTSDPDRLQTSTLPSVFFFLLTSTDLLLIDTSALHLHSDFSFASPSGQQMTTWVANSLNASVDVVSSVVTVSSMSDPSPALSAHRTTGGDQSFTTGGDQSFTTGGDQSFSALLISDSMATASLATSGGTAPTDINTAILSTYTVSLGNTMVDTLASSVASNTNFDATNTASLSTYTVPLGNTILDSWASSLASSTNFDTVNTSTTLPPYTLSTPGFITALASSTLNVNEASPSNTLFTLSTTPSEIEPSTVSVNSAHSTISATFVQTFEGLKTSTTTNTLTFPETSQNDTVAQTSAQTTYNFETQSSPLYDGSTYGTTTPSYTRPSSWNTATTPVVVDSNSVYDSASPTFIQSSESLITHQPTPPYSGIKDTTTPTSSQSHDSLNIVTSHTALNDNSLLDTFTKTNTPPMGTATSPGISDSVSHSTGTLTSSSPLGTATSPGISDSVSHSTGTLTSSSPTFSFSAGTTFNKVSTENAYNSGEALSYTQTISTQSIITITNGPIDIISIGDSLYHTTVFAGMHSYDSLKTETMTITTASPGVQITDTPTNVQQSVSSTATASPVSAYDNIISPTGVTTTPQPAHSQSSATVINTPPLDNLNWTTQSYTISYGQSQNTLTTSYSQPSNNVSTNTLTDSRSFINIQTTVASLSIPPLEISTPLFTGSIPHTITPNSIELSLKTYSEVFTVTAGSIQNTVTSLDTQLTDGLNSLTQSTSSDFNSAYVPTNTQFTSKLSSGLGSNTISENTISNINNISTQSTAIASATIELNTLTNTMTTIPIVETQHLTFSTSFIISLDSAQFTLAVSAPLSTASLHYSTTGSAATTPATNTAVVTNYGTATNVFTASDAATFISGVSTTIKTDVHSPTVSTFSSGLLSQSETVSSASTSTTISPNSLVATISIIPSTTKSVDQPVNSQNQSSDTVSGTAILSPTTLSIPPNGLSTTSPSYPSASLSGSISDITLPFQPSFTVQFPVTTTPSGEQISATTNPMNSLSVSSTSPGSIQPATTVSSIPSTSSTAILTPASSSSSTPVNITVPPANQSSQQRDDRDKIIGITVGVIGGALLILAAIVAYHCWRKREQARSYQSMDGQSTSSEQTADAGEEPISKVRNDVIFDGVIPRFPHYKDFNGVEAFRPPYFTMIDIGSEGHNIIKGSVVKPEDVSLGEKRSSFKQKKNGSPLKSVQFVNPLMVEEIEPDSLDYPSSEGLMKKGIVVKSVKFQNTTSESHDYEDDPSVDYDTESDNDDQSPSRGDDGQSSTYVENDYATVYSIPGDTEPGAAKTADRTLYPQSREAMDNKLNGKTLQGSGGISGSFAIRVPRTGGPQGGPVRKLAGHRALWQSPDVERHSKSDLTGSKRLSLSPQITERVQRERERQCGYMYEKLNYN